MNNQFEWGEDFLPHIEDDLRNREFDMTITLDCTICKQRKLQLIPDNPIDMLLILGKYEPKEEKVGRSVKLVYSGVCRLCETKKQLEAK